MTVGIIHSVDPETSLKQRAPRLQTVPFLPALTGKRKERRTSVRRSVADCISAGCFRLLWEGGNISGEGRRINAGQP